MRSAWINIVGYAVTRGIALVATLVFARVLGPGAYGVLAIAAIISLALTVLRDLGLGANLIQRDPGDEEIARATLSLFIVIGVVISAGVAAASVVFELLGDQEMRDALLFLSAGFLLGVPGWYLSPELQRVGRFGFLVFGQIVGAVSGAVIGVALVLLGKGPAGVILGQSMGVLATTLVLLTSKLLVYPIWSRRLLRKALVSASGFFSQSALGFLSQNSDNVAVGLILGRPALGLYAPCYRVAELPYVGIVAPVSQAVFPKYVQMRHAGQDVFELFRRVSMALNLVTIPLAGVFIISGSALLPLLFGPEWEPAVNAFTLLGVWAAFRPLQATYGWLLNGMGFVRDGAQIAAVVLPFSLMSLAFGAWSFGLEGVAVAMIVDILLSLGLLVRMTAKRLGSRFLFPIKESLGNYLCGILALGVTFSVRGSFGGNNPAVSGGALFVGIYVIGSMISRRRDIALLLSRRR